MEKKLFIQRFPREEYTLEDMTKWHKTTEVMLPDFIVVTIPDDVKIDIVNFDRSDMFNVVE